MQENCFIKMGHHRKKQQHKPKEGMQVLPLFLSHSRFVVMKQKLTLLVTFLFNGMEKYLIMSYQVTNKNNIKIMQ